MAFIKRDFDKRATVEEKIEPKRIIVVACEDENVQPAYFNAIKERLNIPTITEVAVLPCVDGKSAVEHVCANLIEYIEKQKLLYDFDERDQFWIVIDRESPKNVCHKILLTKLRDCEEIGTNVKVGVTNPLFELWLLLHVADLSQYDKEELLSNERTGSSKSSKRFIDKKLSELLGGYSKEKKKIFKTMEKIVTKENVQKAIKRERSIENGAVQIITMNNLGSNVGKLVQTIMTNDEE
jgi:hypothetical protein